MNDTVVQQGLYTPQLEKASCGIGMVANLSNIPTHQLVEDAIAILERMEHRGACGCEENTGDGAGILVQVPHKFFTRKAKEKGYVLPDYGRYGVGTVFFPMDRKSRSECRILFNDYCDELGLEVLGYRKVPTDHEDLGDTAISVEPRMEQVFIKPKEEMEPDALERRLYVLRKYATHNVHITYPHVTDQFYITSFSYKTVVYKGQLTTGQLRSYFSDLQSLDFESAIALVHSRFSTNTVPKWKLAQPFRYMAHNGEINTIQGNKNWWISKEQMLETSKFTEDELEKLLPICGTDLSDSANFDNVLEFLVLGGYELPHALMMMIPEAWRHNPKMKDYKKKFYEFHENLMEAWDGPASVCFTDGKLVGATLDRNGLRPSRYCLTSDNVLILASEAGVLPIDQSKIVLKGRLQPGKMLIADLEEHKIIGDDELKDRICQQLPYADWLTKHTKTVADLPKAKPPKSFGEKELKIQQKIFGFSKEDINVIIGPMVSGKKDPIGSMGSDTPLAILSKRSQHLGNYFKQLFAQVTNPPIDPIREKAVMSLACKLGGSSNIMKPGPHLAKFIHLDSPVLKNEELAAIKALDNDEFKAGVIDITFKAADQKGLLRAAISRISAEAEDLTRQGANVLILSDRSTSKDLAPIPSLMATGAIHHHLIKAGLRNSTSLIVEGGDIRETHHLATLVGYGANAINPYMSFASIEHLHEIKYFDQELTLEAGIDSYIYAMGAGLMKIMSKIGISTIQSYHGAQIFEAIGLGEEVIEKCFKGTVSRIKGISFNGVAKETMIRFNSAFVAEDEKIKLDVGGVFQWKRRGEYHLFNPQTIHLLQYSSRTNDYEMYKKFAKLIDDQSEQACTLRGLMSFRKTTSIDVDDVEPIENIMRRFVTGAMSFGSISHEAHSTLAVAMNRIGGKSNSGEGGEDEVRFEKKANGDWERSATKQVASGRFGVTSYYLSNAEELQIKMAQGAKPGEGGQLPGHKVDDWIGRVRHSTPGVGLISPPPHHDIYSIEDLAQLIYDLKNANRKARVNVKLVSKAGVGIIASGVAKAHADAILISGHDGGTGASPLSSIRHAGLPWELGLAESHQTLVKNQLRDRVTLQTDGQLRTGRDIAIATLLGAEEWGVATAALVVEGCILMRKCHLNTCPVGIATQDPDLRARYNGTVESVINYFRFMATDMRERMAKLGFRTVNEMVGKVELLKFKHVDFWKYENLDLSPILYKVPSSEHVGQYKKVAQNHGIDDVLDRKLIKYAAAALESGYQVQSKFEIKNTDRATGTMLSNEISKKYKGAGLPDGVIDYRFRGSAGQSFGAFGAHGLQFTLEGEANDYFGKGLSGGRLIVVPDRDATFNPSDNIIIGNVAFYGATSGEAYIKGMAGERFGVRNSGVHAVVEGTGDHGAEYMTGGVLVVIGKTGKNFAAGMSGGMAFIYNKDGDFEERCNPSMVDLDPLSSEDETTLRQLIRNHFKFTSSKVALDILNDWDDQKKHFTKVMPRDYKRVLNERRERAAKEPKGERAGTV